MFSRILIANRGEIACRITRTARRLGVSTVAVYSDADAGALHVSMADEAVRIGPAAAAESYLDGDRIIAAALATEAEAIHPGYGFLSENAGFADAVRDAGLVFIGPSGDAIRAMGLKDAAKRLMREAGVPVVPGYLGDDQDPAVLAAEAAAIGYPVLIKARAGGGGKGMRRVEAADAFEAALAGARREAEASFGDPACLVEKWVASPRHIEVQVFGDGHGNVVHLNERDCSLQRRHQKVIEEAPAPGMDAEMRAAMGEAAVRAAKAIGYSGAGTIEFIVDASEGLRPDRFYFMEMNTRLQVEHPVTEAITGLDLVEWQLRVAAGEPLPLAQSEIPLDGWAMEARIYAEDPAAGFLPATGRLDRLDLPATRARIDSGVREGDRITPWYDPLIAKLVVHAPTRDAVVQRLAAALDECRIAGSITNLGFLARLARDADFRAGRVDTGLIERRGEALTAPATPSNAATALAGLVALGLARPAQGNDCWDRLRGWRLWAEASQHVTLDHLGRRIDLTVVGQDGGHAVSGDGWTVILRILAADADVRLAVDGRIRTVAVARHGPAVTVFEGAEAHVFTETDWIDGDAAEEATGDRVLSPLPGLVRAVLVRPGEAVRRGVVLAVVEAMKMEHTMTAPRDGTVATVAVAPGDQVEQGAVVVEFEPEAGT